MRHADLDQIATSVALKYKRRASWVDVDEFRQVAWLAICRAARTFNPVVGIPLKAYVRRAAVLACGNALHRFSHAASAGLGNHHLHELVDCGPPREVYTDIPKRDRTDRPRRGAVPRTVVEVESVLDLARAAGTDAGAALDAPPDAPWRASVGEALGELAAEEPLGELVVDVLLSDERPSVVAQRAGVEPRALISAVGRVRRAIACDYTLWKLHKARVRGES